VKPASLLASEEVGALHLVLRGAGGTRVPQEAARETTHPHGASVGGADIAATTQVVNAALLVERDCDNPLGKILYYHLNQSTLAIKR
jgi:hypothetical protein